MSGKSGITKIRVNSAAVSALLKSPEVEADLLRRANAIASVLPQDNGEEWFVNSHVGTRARATVGTANQAAKKSASEDASLQAAISAGR